MKCKCCGSDTERPEKVRSLPQHRRYFAMIRAFHHHWPETAAIQFSSEHELRVWAQMKAGWRDVGARIPLVGMSVERARMLAEAAIRGAGSYAIPVVHKGELIVWTPQSIAFGVMGPAEFCALNDAVATVLEQESGLKVEAVMKETEAAA